MDLNFHVESLDSGHIVTVNGQRKAFQYSKDIIDWFTTISTQYLEKLGSSGTDEMSVSFSVEINSPKQSKD